jgi:DNA invertase Pin-like site-specific DNA recombinase
MTLNPTQITATNPAMSDADIVAGDLDMTSSGKFVSYLRVSTDKQGKSGLGIEAQRESVLNYLNGGNWSLVKEFVEVESGKRTDRPMLAEAIKACRVFGAKLVIAKLDRLSRDAHFLLGLEKAGVDFVAADMPNANRLTVGIMAMVAEEERRMISQRTKDALAAAKKRGTKLGGIRHRVISTDASGKKTYGEQVINVSSKTGKLAVKALQARADAKAADLAPIIKELQAAGKTSLRAIATGLNEAGIPTARGGEWSSPQVMRILERLEPSRASRPFEASTSV